jgi:arabinan endo-1,5-alpha-L-arabinosidase
MQPNPSAPRPARPGALRRRRRFAAVARLLAAAIAVSTLLGALAAPAAATGSRYHNPLRPAIPGDGVVESCADPSVIYGQQGERRWYMYCTTDPLNDQDRTASGFNFHLIPMMSSADLVHWRYEGDAFTTRPSYATPNAGLWAPEIIYHPEQPDGADYYLYYTVTDTTLPGGGSAIGVATGPTPLGPWTHRDSPVVEPHAADCCPGSRRWVFDPDVLRTSGPDYIYYGSYFGGISVRQLSEDGFTTDASTQSNVAIANKFEGAEVEYRGGYYYLFASATDCCRGPLTGYAVFVGRSTSPRGPFLDRDGVSMNDNEGPDEADPTNARAGGTPVSYQNGNRWVGTGHNTLFRDFAGQWWTIYHAVNINDPYFDTAPGFTKRPPMLDAIDWVNGWPTLNGGRGPSDTWQPAPAAQPGRGTAHRYIPAAPELPGERIGRLSDSFPDSHLGRSWTWVREPAPGTWSVSGGQLHIDTQAADLFENSNNASVLTEPTPGGSYVVDTKVRVTVPAEGCCFNYVQAGLVIYGDDDNFIKLVNVSIFNTRQTEFAKEVGPAVPAGYPRYGNTVVGAPGEWTWLRIVKRPAPAGAPGGLYGGGERYTAYTSRDGIHWTRGGTWLHHLGASARIGLVSMGGSGFRADFDYVRVSRLRD